MQNAQLSARRRHRDVYITVGNLGRCSLLTPDPTSCVFPEKSCSSIFDSSNTHMSEGKAVGFSLCESFSIRVLAVARGSDTNTEQPSVLQFLSQRGQGRRQRMIRLRTSPGFMVKGIPRMMIMIHAIECRNRDRTLKDALVRATLQQKSDACLARDKSLQSSSRQSPQYLRAE